MRAAIIALMLSFATPVGAECGNICDADWWKSATEADVQAELDGGADVMARNKFGHTPLLWAAEHGTPAIIQALLAAGADVMARTDTGWTPLNSAALAGTVTFNAKPANIQALLDAGADAKAKSKYGETPWDLAQLNDRLKGTKSYWALNDAQYN